MATVYSTPDCKNKFSIFFQFCRSESNQNVPPDKEEPPTELRSIIDKMAQYVVRNGPEFEMMMKSKKDDRFGFLESCHKYNRYYEQQVSEFRHVMENAEKGEEEGPDSAAGQRGEYIEIIDVENNTLYFD